MKKSVASTAGVLLVLVPVCIVFLCFYIADIYKDRQQHVVITGATPMFAASEEGRGLCSYTDQNRIATIAPGEQVAVRRIVYEKDCMTVKIRRNSGQEGFIVAGKGAWQIQ